MIAVFSSVQFSRSVVSNSLKPHESQHTRPPCPSPTPGVHSAFAPVISTTLVAGVIFIINPGSGLKGFSRIRWPPFLKPRPLTEKTMSTKRFNSNETLEMCDVRISENGQIEISTKSYHTTELDRLGKPEKAIRGRMKMVEKNFVFDPYAEGSRKPTFSKQVVVGSTTLAVTEDKVKVSFLVPRHLSKPLMTLYIQSEIDEVKRRLDTDVYDSLIRGQQSTVNSQQTKGGAA